MPASESGEGRGMLTTWSVDMGMTHLLAGTTEGPEVAAMAKKKDTQKNTLPLSYCDVLLLKLTSLFPVSLVQWQSSVNFRINSNLDSVRW